ncbi:MAG: hypothetical protein JSV19_02245, partial [Phycisphaerales bacterium]
AEAITRQLRKLEIAPVACVAAIVMLATGIGIPLSLLWIVTAYLCGRWPGELGKALLPALAVSGASLAVLYPVAVRPLYRKAKTGFKDLQQQTAVELARELHRADVRRRLRRA